MSSDNDTLANEIEEHLPTAIRQHIIHDLVHVVCHTDKDHKIHDFKFITFIDSDGIKYHFCTVEEQVNWLIENYGIDSRNLLCSNCSTMTIYCNVCDSSPYDEKDCSQCGESLTCPSCCQPECPQCGRDYRCKRCDDV